MKTAKIPFRMLKAGTQFIYKDDLGFLSTYIKLDDGYQHNCVQIEGGILTSIYINTLVMVKYFIPD